MPTAVIVDVVRTASGRGKPGGALSGVHPVDLAAGVLEAVLERNGLESRQVDDVLLGCVSQVADQAMNIARQAVLAAGSLLLTLQIVAQLLRVIGGARLARGEGIE